MREGDLVNGPGESPNGNTDSEEAQADVVDVAPEVEVRSKMFAALDAVKVHGIDQAKEEKIRALLAPKEEGEQDEFHYEIEKSEEMAMLDHEATCEQFQQKLQELAGPEPEPKAVAPNAPSASTCGRYCGDCGGRSSGSDVLAAEA